MVDTEKKSSTRIRNITCFSIFIMLVFSWIVVDQVSKSEKIARDEAVSNDTRLLNVMSQQMELAFIGVDNALHRAVEHYLYTRKSANPADTIANMQMLVNSSPRLAAMIMVDEHGIPVMAANKKPYGDRLDYSKYSFANNTVFQELRNGTDKRYHIGRLHNEKNNGFDFIIMGHKIANPDGSFGGAFIAAIDPYFFIKYFKTVEQGSRSYIALQIIDSGEILVDGPMRGSYYSELNSMALIRFNHAGEKDENIVNTYQVNGSTKIYGYVKLKSLPLLINIVLDDADYLKAWRETRLKDYCFLFIFIVFGSLLSFFAVAMARQVIQVQKSESAAVLASQAKSEFLANMSHELRTPLNAIIGFSEMMNSGYFGQLNPKQKERIHDINLCGSHLLNLITDILEFSKGDAGKLELVEEKVVMRDIVSESLRIMNKKIKEKQMNIITEIEDIVPDILGDKRKIRQILLNLLSNSIKFTPDGGTIKISVAQDAGRNVTMTVSDTGVGIAEKDIPIALSVFGQVHRNQSHEGTGLGLPLCKMFTELHGGRLAFGSVIDEGTTVRITFPTSRNMEA